MLEWNKTSELKPKNDQLVVGMWPGDDGSKPELEVLFYNDEFEVLIYSDECFFINTTLDCVEDPHYWATVNLPKR
jgi:hypothetical protein